MTAGRRLVDALAAVAARYGPGDRAEKLSLLDALERTRLRAAGPPPRLPQALCFLPGHPRPPPGVAGPALASPFGSPMARWLARRFRADAEIAWARFDEADRLDETLSLLASPAGGDALSGGGVGGGRGRPPARAPRLPAP